VSKVTRSGGRFEYEVRRDGSEYFRHLDNLFFQSHVSIALAPHS
jgi:hypothetical protein